MRQNNIYPSLVRVHNLCELEPFGTRHFKIVPNDTIKFDLLPNMPIYSRGKTFYVGCLVNKKSHILPISMFRRAISTDYYTWATNPELKTNRILYDLPNDRAFVEFIQGKTLKCIRMIEGDHPTFYYDRNFGKSIVQRDVDGNIITVKCRYPVFEII